MTYQRQHDRLLSEWADRPHHRGAVFISDGIIDPARWCDASRRVAFLLKEAYGGDANWDLCSAIREEWGANLGPTLRKAAYLTYAAHHLTETHLPEIPSESFELARGALLSSAIVNIKKSHGESTSDPDDIASFLDRDRSLILEQLRIIDPEIIVCGGTWYCAKTLWPKAKYIYDMVWADSQRFFVDFWHPGDRTPDQAAYYAFSAVLRFGGISSKLPPRSAA